MAKLGIKNVEIKNYGNKIILKNNEEITKIICGRDHSILIKNNK